MKNPVDPDQLASSAVDCISSVNLRFSSALTISVWATSSSLTASLRCGPLARHIYPSLVLVQPRKTRPYITERLLMGHKELNQTNKLSVSREPFSLFHNSVLIRLFLCDDILQ